MSKTVYLGMSGGVDSSVSALLLKQQGYRVVGVYMKNWSQDLPSMQCPWAEDLSDAKRVAVKLDLDFEVWDFEQTYKQKVVDYMLTEFKKGRTPNPDIICNQEIKFKLFYQTALKKGADFIATGHYAQTKHHQLLRAVDENKDQTYFLYRISQTSLEQTLFPIGHLKKSTVKAIATQHCLHNAHKKESMGICFVGEVNIKNFLQQYISLQPGEIRHAETDTVLGTHDGVIFYTIGQRHGLYLSGELPYYIVKKDLKNNRLYVSQNLNHPALWTQRLTLKKIFFRTDQIPTHISVRLRHRAPLIPATLTNQTLHFTHAIKRPAPGQSAVFYHQETCLGGGIID